MYKRQVVEGAGVDAAAAEHLRLTLEALPGLVEKIHDALDREGGPPSARELFLRLVRYLFTENDLIPAHAGEVLLGLVDDAYLVHRAAQEMRGHLSLVDMRSVDGGAALLRALLPDEIVDALDEVVAEARAAGGG